MGLATVEDRYLTVHKVYPPDMHERAAREVRIYQELPWATPRLDCYGEGWLEMEKCTPILDLLPEQSVKYREPLRDLLRRVHEAGWWHMDVCLRNVVIHPVRGVLLIDWEGATRATSNISPDLYGARAAQIPLEDVWEPQRPDGVWWGGPWDDCPGRYWPEDRLVPLEPLP